MIDKKCRKCGLYSLKKNGKRNGKQRYKCKKCGYVFEHKSIKTTKRLWVNYTQWKQTYKQLSVKYGLSIPTIRNRLDAVIPKKFVN